MADDKLVGLEVVTSLKDEVFDALSRGQATGLIEEKLLLETTAAASSDADKIKAEIAKQLLMDPNTYPNTLSVCDGSETTAAKHILEFCLNGVDNGFHWPLVKFMAHFEQICYRVVRR